MAFQLILTMTDFKKYIENNKIAWNKRTPIHIDSEFYNNTDFKNKIENMMT